MMYNGAMTNNTETAVDQAIDSFREAGYITLWFFVLAGYWVAILMCFIFIPTAIAAFALSTYFAWVLWPRKAAAEPVVPQAAVRKVTPKPKPGSASCPQ